MQAFIGHVAAHIAPEVNDWDSLYAFSINRPDAFWSALWAYCGVIDAAGTGQPPEQVTAEWGQMPGTRWFPQARLSYAENLLKRRDDGLAVIFADERGQRRTLSHAALYEAVAQLAQALKAEGVKPGDRVAGWLPNIPETLIGCLAANAIGAVWSSCSPDFGVRGVLDRFGQIEPVVLLCANAYAYNGKVHDCLDKVSDALEELPSVQRVVVSTTSQTMPTACLRRMQSIINRGSPISPRPSNFCICHSIIRSTSCTHLAPLGCPSASCMDKAGHCCNTSKSWSYTPI